MEGRGEVVDPLVEQLPRPVRRAVRGARRASRGWSSSARARAACASSAARSRFIASSSRRSRDSSAPKRRCRTCRRGTPTRDSRRRSSSAGDFVVSDALNHASIIDSMRLAKAITKCTTAVYKHADMDDLESKLESAKGARRRIIWTDGVFSMEGEHREAARHPADRARPRRDRRGRRLARDGRARRKRGAARPSTSACSARSTSSRRRSARRSAARRADSSRGPRRCATC